MSVLEVADYHGPYPGGFIPALVAVGAAVRDRLGLGYHCVFPEAVAERPWVGLLREAGIDATFLPGALGRRERIGRLRALARERDARVLRTHFTAWDLDGALAARRAGARCVWNVHTGNLVRRPAADLVKARLLGRLCDAVIAVSPEIRREALERGFPERKVHLVPNGIPLEPFEHPPERAAARARLDLPADARVALAFCWDPHTKGADVLLRAGEGLDGVLVVIVGRDLLEAALPARRPPWLRVLAPLDDPRPLFAAADVFVSASRQEAFSFAIGEAMAMRLPVVSSRIPGPATYFDAPGVRTYPAEDPAALRDAIAAALADGPAAGEANRAWVTERLGLDRHVDGVLAVYRSLL